MLRLTDWMKDRFSPEETEQMAAEVAAEIERIDRRDECLALARVRKLALEAAGATPTREDEALFWLADEVRRLIDELREAR